MRPDMAKVVTERPRAGHDWNKNRRNDKTATRGRVRVADLDDDDLPPLVSRAAKHPVSPRRPENRGWVDAKSFSDLIGPLRRYLRKQVGRPWDTVWSELSATLDKRSVSGSHIFDHIEREVELHCYRYRGRIYMRPRFYGAAHEVEGLYVHPGTRLLCWTPRRRWRARLSPAFRARAAALKPFGIGLASEREADNWRVADDLTVLERVEGVWYVHQYRRQNPDEVVDVKMVGGRAIPITRGQRGDPLLIRVARWQLGRRERRLWALAQGA